MSLANAFSNFSILHTFLQSRVPFEVPSEVQWQHVKKVLNALWTEHTGRGLEEEHFTFMARLIFSQFPIMRIDAEAACQGNDSGVSNLWYK
jgi:hypothetical protein